LETWASSTGVVLILSHQAINRLKDLGHLPRYAQVGPSSVDLHLSNTFAQLGVKQKFLFLDSESVYQHTVTDDFLLEPNKFVLASTQEKVSVPNHLAAFVAGLEGQITLELYNQSEKPILLKAGVRICQLVFFQLDETTEKPYSGKYQNQQGATVSRLYQDFEA
jgi:dCTP deaminase